LLHLPDDLDDRQVAALLMKGMTAHYLLHRTYKVQAGDTILVHAAAGGMGLILCQWAKALGATIVGTVSTEEKAEAARAAGCDHAVVRSRDDFVAKVREVTDGEGAAVVYEAIGKDTLQQSLDCLRLMGVCAAYGHVSGPPDPVDIIQDLGRRGSLFITRPAIMHYVAKRSDLEWAARDLFKAIRDGIIDANINYEYALKDAVKAHQAIESGTTFGATVLIP
jgi:NADPH2:quinone reductase